MKRFIYSLVFSVGLSLIFALSAAAQEVSTFSDKNVEYTFDLPDAVWKMNLKPSAKDPNVEYIYGDRLNGYLRIQKLSVKPNETLSDVTKNTDEKLQFKPGYVAGKEENFAGNYKGKVSNYEYVQSGRNMSGRIYFLKTDDATVYILHFTGLRDQLRPIRNQIDSIARTFKVKAA
ncbi:MAG: hypothetical protein ACR2N3_16670 [Pyrinomonadaceae bacterium]